MKNRPRLKHALMTSSPDRIALAHLCAEDIADEGHLNERVWASAYLCRDRVPIRPGEIGLASHGYIVSYPSTERVVAPINTLKPAAKGMRVCYFRVHGGAVLLDSGDASSPDLHAAIREWLDNEIEELASELWKKVTYTDVMVAHDRWPWRRG